MKPKESPDCFSPPISDEERGSNRESAAQSVQSAQSSVQSAQSAPSSVQSELSAQSAASLSRIDKVLSRNGFGSRKDVKKLLRRGAILLNGKPVYDPAVHVNIQSDVISLLSSNETVSKQTKIARDSVSQPAQSVSARVLTLRGEIYLMMNKPAGVVCANRDKDHRTVFDLFDCAPQSSSFSHAVSFSAGKLHCAGRLDLDSEGLLIITSDGKLSRKILSPDNHVPKTYAVSLRDEIDKSTKKAYTEKFARGFLVERERDEKAFVCKSARLEWAEEIADKIVAENARGFHCVLTIYEGKFHQVKRMFQSVNNSVVSLKRIKIGSLNLDRALPSGRTRELTQDEIKELTQAD